MDARSRPDSSPGEAIGTAKRLLAQVSIRLLGEPFCSQALLACPSYPDIVNEIVNEIDAVEFWCREGQHSSCLHVPYDSVEWTEETVDEPGLHAFKMAKRPYAVRDTSSIRPCQCPCHVDCPLSGQDYADRWLETCDCPGTLRFIEQQRDSDIGTQVRAAIDEARRKKQARSELRHRSVGLRRDQIEGLLDVIWSEHGLPVPDASVRPALLDAPP